MANRYREIAFTDSVREFQRAAGSRQAYAALEGGADTNQRLGPDEAAFIGARDSFYMATVGETGWPYVQHRGGPAGFVRVLDETHIGFADVRGNRQYISAGNLVKDDRVSLFFMDYRHKARLKMLGHARLVGLEDDGTLSKLTVPGQDARVERGIVIRVAGFDWNCPQHITPRFTAAEIDEVTRQLYARVGQLEAELEALRQGRQP